jgi:hypothetical protein
MSEIYDRIIQLISSREIRISMHGYDELSADNIYIRDILDGASKAHVVEEYPDFPKGKCVLVMKRDAGGAPMHIVWGIPRGLSKPAVLITAYRPDPSLWHDDFIRRKS